MKKLAFLFLIIIPAAIVFLPVGCNKKEEPETEALVLLSEEPLLLLDNSDSFEDLGPATGPVADNSRCHVCHMNYEVEELAIRHARANVGCEKCHGPSEKHCSDEDNITGPDIMYSKKRINTSCMAAGCHPKSEIDNLYHKTTLKDPEANKTYCTNCHGDHLVSHRTRRWNKDTGELLEDDNVRLSDQRPEEAE